MEIEASKNCARNCEIHEELIARAAEIEQDGYVQIDKRRLLAGEITLKCSGIIHRSKYPDTCPAILECPLRRETIKL